MLARKRRPLIAVEHRQNNLEGFLELLETIGERSEFEAERVVLELKPTGTNAELCAPVGNNIERRHDLGEERRVSIRVAGHERTEADGARLARERAEQRVTLKHVRFGITEHRQLIEVIHHHHRVEATAVGGLRLRGNLVEQASGVDAGVGEVRDLVAETSH